MGGSPMSWPSHMGRPPMSARPTAQIISRVQVPVGATASSPVSETHCVAVRLGGEQVEENQRPVGVRT